MTKTQDTMIRDALRAGRNVSVDDMNLRTRYVLGVCWGSHEARQRPSRSST